MASIPQFALAASPFTGQDLIDGLIETDDAVVANYWNYQAALTGDAVVTYAFELEGVASTRFSTTGTVTEFDPAQRASARLAMDQMATITGIRMQEVTDGNAADIVFGITDLGEGTAGSTGISVGWTSSGQMLTGCTIRSAIAIDDAYAASGLQPGEFGYQILLHEIGHAFGLKHPHEGTPVVAPEMDDSAYSVMSYDYVLPYSGGYTSYDRLALQALYGTDGLMGQGIGIAYSTFAFSGIATFSQTDWYVTVASGASSADQLYLDGAGVSITVSGIETVVGGIGGDTLSLATGGQDLTVSAIETVFGGSGADRLTLAAGSTVIMVAVETLVGSAATDLATLGNRGNTTTISAIEVLAGGGGADWVTLGDGGQAMSISSVETLIGGNGGDQVTLLAAATITVAAVETLLGSAGADWLTLGNRGNTIQIASIETIIGGSGVDGVSMLLADTVTLAGLESLWGSIGSDWVTLGNRGNTIHVAGVETIIGGSAPDRLTLLSATTMIIAAIESVSGSSGLDAVTLGNRGNTIGVSAVETLSGGTGDDWVTLGEGGQTVFLSSVETLLGGAGTDSITLGSAATMVLAAVEVVTGSSGQDALTLGARGGTVSLSAIETVTGGAGNDLLGVSSGAVSFTGGAGADWLALPGGTAADRVVLTDVGDGAAVSLATGSDTVTGFQTGSDLVVLGGSLRTALDHDGDGMLGMAYRASGGAVPGTDELILLTAPISGTLVSDTYFTNFRAALGSVPGGTAPATTAVLGTDAFGTSGLYLFEDADANGTLGALEIRLLAVLPSTTLSVTDFTFG